MCPVIHSRHDETEDEERYSPRFCLISDHAASAAFSVVDQCAQQTEDWSRCTHCVSCPTQKRYGYEHTSQRTCRKSYNPRNRVNNYHPGRTIHFRRGRCELPDPHHVEKYVQQSAMQPACC